VAKCHPIQPNSQIFIAGENQPSLPILWPAHFARFPSQSPAFQQRSPPPL
jgi:hypothetical protein